MLRLSAALTAKFHHIFDHLEHTRNLKCLSITDHCRHFTRWDGEQPWQGEVVDNEIQSSPSMYPENYRWNGNPKKSRNNRRSFIVSVHG
jgi:hypothetical protein